MSPILDSIGSVKAYGWGSLVSVPNSFESIATVSVGSGGTNNVTFNDIPQTYKHLQVRAIAQSEKSSAVDYLAMRINGDAGANYTVHLLYGGYGTGSSASSYAATGNASYDISEFPASSSTSVYGALVLDILDYGNTNKYKTIRHLGNNDRNGAGQVQLSSGLWLSTSAITSLSFYFAANDIAQYSHFALYGIKGAA